jgi:hypothetical protein
MSPPSGDRHHLGETRGEYGPVGAIWFKARDVGREGFDGGGGIWPAAGVDIGVLVLELPAAWAGPIT